MLIDTAYKVMRDLLVLPHPVRLFSVLQTMGAGYSQATQPDYPIIILTKARISHYTYWLRVKPTIVAVKFGLARIKFFSGGVVLAPTVACGQNDAILFLKF